MNCPQCGEEAKTTSPKLDWKHRVTFRNQKIKIVVLECPHYHHFWVDERDL